MRFAYIILAHKLPHQLVRLVRALDSPNAIFFIHIDRRSPPHVADPIHAAIDGKSNIVFLERRRCQWGGFGLLAVTLDALRDIAHSPQPSDFAILLTGQDYPIKPTTYIEAFMEGHPGTSFLSYWSLPTTLWHPKGGVNRIAHWHTRRWGLHVQLPLRREVPNGLRPYGGAAFWCLPLEVVRYVDEFARSRPAVIDFFKHVDVPDELFFQTVILNSPFQHRVVNDHLRFIDWGLGDRTHPAILTREQVPALAASKHLFARKFDETEDAGVLDLIDEHIREAGPSNR
jgi:hypothetical protein